MQRKQLVALILTLVFTLSTLCVPTTAASSDIQLTFSLTDVSGEVPTLELGLNVDTENVNTANEEKFKAVGVVLEFDNTVLGLIPWQTYVEYDLSYATDWSTAVPIGTVGIDEYMSSAAQAYTVGNTTYLYLSAEAVTPQSLPDGAQVATVRFAYKEGMSAADVKPGETVKLAADNGVVFDSPIQHGAVYHNDVDFYYHNPLTENKGKVQSDASIAAEYLLRDPIYDAVKSGESIVPGGGGVNMDNVLSIAFYDWDETLLGFLAVPKEEDISLRVNDYVRNFIHPDLNDTQEEGESLTEDDIKAMMASNARADTYRGKFPSTYGDDSTIDLTGKGYPLTNKLDYVFYKGDTTAEDYDGYYFAHGWIPVTAQTLDGRAENGVFTAYESADAAAAANPVDFSAGLTESIMVKAAYVPGEDLKTMTPEDYYTITNKAYNRYGTITADTGSYSMIATVERVNADKYGVTRLRRPAFRMFITPDVDGAQPVAVRIDVDSKDETTAEIIAPRLSAMTAMEYVDVTVENWLGVALKADKETIPRDGEQGYLIQGTVKAVNTAVKERYEAGSGGDNTFNNIVNTLTYDDLGCTLSAELLGITNARNFAAAARNRLLLGYVANCGQEMSYEYIKVVLSMKLDTPGVNSTSVYNAAIAKIQAAVEANGNQPLDMNQIADVINGN